MDEIEQENTGDMIRDAMEQAGLEPVKFDKPLKSLTAYVKLTKKIEPEHLAEVHQAMGWALGVLVEQFGKCLYRIKTLAIQNQGRVINIEATVSVSFLTFEDDHGAAMDGYIASLKGREYKTLAYIGFSHNRRQWAWDTVERISEISGFQAMDGSGRDSEKIDG
jgi:hypothetical protein